MNISYALIRILIFSILMFLTQKGFCDLENKLILYYSFDEIKPNKQIIDKSGCNNTGYIVGNIIFKEGISGRGACFNGADTRIKVKSSKSLETDKGLTVCMWIKPERVKVKYDIKAKRDSQELTFNGWNWRCRINHLGRLELILQGFKQNNKTSIRLKLEQSLTKNKWVHLAYVFSALKKKVYFYINGKCIIEKNVDLDALRIEKGWFMLGGGPSGWNPYMGVIDEVKVYNYALTGKELNEISIPVSGEKLKIMQQKVNEASLALTGHNMIDKETKKSLLNECNSVEKELLNSKKSSTMRFECERSLNKRIDFLSLITCQLKDGDINLKNTICWIVPPISNAKRLPDAFPEDGKLSNEIRIVATPGEFEPASFVLMTYKDLQDVVFSVSDLISSSKQISAGSLDIKVVKCWYQGSTAWHGIMKGNPDIKMLVPELLLNDDKLIKVDNSKKVNYIKADFPNETRYLNISSAENVGTLIYLPVSKFPVKDSSKLLPVNLPAGVFKQFWITCKVPQDAQPGSYSGKITVSDKKNKLGELSVKIRVLPFKLPEPATRYDLERRFTTSIYYKSILNPVPEAAITVKNRSAKQIKAELTNMLNHGVCNPLEYQLQWSYDVSRLEKVLAIRKEVGMGSSALYLLGPEGNMGLKTRITPESLAEYRRKLIQLKEISKKWNNKELYVYGIDEAKAPAVKKERRFIEEAHKLGVKVFQSGFSGPSRPIPERYPDYYPLISDLLDLLIKTRPISAVETAKWHDKGKLMWAYGIPQAGVENPLVNRRNYGFRLWQSNYDGFATYLYYGGFGNPWNDFDNKAYRDHNYVYPTTDGVIDTIAWEGVREAVDDIRYATKLSQLIRQAEKTGNKESMSLAAKYKKWLEETDFSKGNLDLMRLEIIKSILNLKDLIK